MPEFFEIGGYRVRHGRGTIPVLVEDGPVLHTIIGRAYVAGGFTRGLSTKIVVLGSDGKSLKSFGAVSVQVERVETNDDAIASGRVTYLLTQPGTYKIYDLIPEGQNEETEEPITVVVAASAEVVL